MRDHKCADQQRKKQHAHRATTRQCHDKRVKTEITVRGLKSLAGRNKTNNGLTHYH